MSWKYLELYPLNAHFRFYRRKTDETGSTLNKPIKMTSVSCTDFCRVMSVTYAEIQDHLEAHPAIKGVYDMKATYVGPNRIRMKAEIDMDGSVIAQDYLSLVDKTYIRSQSDFIHSNSSSFDRADKMRDILTEHINGGVDHVGKEIDTIEASIKQKFPQIKHVDLEIL